MHFRSILVAFLAMSLVVTPFAWADETSDAIRQLNERSGAGLSHEDNAFVALLPLLEPHIEGQSAGHTAACREALGLPASDGSGASAVSLVWFPEWAEANAVDDETARSAEETMLAGPWKAQASPEVDRWLDAQAEALAAFASAVRRPGYFAPLTRASPEDTLVEVLLPHLGTLRMHARAVQASANRAIGTGDTAAVLRHVETLRRLADHLRHEPTQISNLVAISIDRIAADVARDWIEAEPLGSADAVGLGALMPDRPNGLRIADTVDRAERAFLVDFLRWSQRDMSQLPEDHYVVQDYPALARAIRRPEFDAAQAATQLNALTDRVVSAMRLEPYAEAAKATEAIETELETWNPPAWWAAIEQGEPVEASSLPASTNYTDVVVEAMVRQFFPAFTAAVRTEAQADIRRTLIRIAAGLEVYRAEHGRYPDNLSDSPRDLTGTIPPDLDGQPLRYEVRNEGSGYTLRSIGHHGDPDLTLPEATANMLTIKVDR